MPNKRIVLIIGLVYIVFNKLTMLFKMEQIKFDYDVSLPKNSPMTYVISLIVE